MTREEAIEIFRSNEIRTLIEDYSATALEDMIDAIISIPPTPSDLDEAAEDYAWQNTIVNEENKPHSVIEHEFTKDVFKAGAEWMAGQGVTEVSRLYRDPNPPHEGLFFGVLPFFSTIQMALNYQDGEEVIVQIRKK